MKIYKIYSLLGLCYIYSMNPVEGELMDEVEIQLPEGYQEVGRDNNTRGIHCPCGYTSTMFFGPDPTIFEYTEEDQGKYTTFSLTSK